MLYVLADWTMSEEGASPDLPEDCSFLNIAGSSSDQSFGLFRVSDRSDEHHDRLRSQTVPKSLSVLLESCRAYPPALAGAVQDLGPMPPEEFVRVMELRLLDQLNGQRAKPYLLARSRVGELGYRAEGEFVWVVAYRPERIGREVTWVASDYKVYSDAIDSFDLDPSWLAARFSAERKDVESGTAPNPAAHGDPGRS